MIATPFSLSEKFTEQSIEVAVETIEWINRDEAHPTEPHLEEIFLREATILCRLTRNPEAKLGKGARKTFVTTLVAFWREYFDAYGNPIQPPAFQIQPSLDNCLLALHCVNNASSLFLPEEPFPWNVNEIVLSMLHLAMTDPLSFESISFPRRCDQCHSEIIDPSRMEVVTAEHLHPEMKPIFFFGLWSLKRILDLCIKEPRPELWGLYSRVLNYLQWLLPMFPCSIQRRPISASDVLQILQQLEEQITNRRGQKGSAPALTAYPEVIFRALFALTSF